MWGGALQALSIVPPAMATKLLSRYIYIQHIESIHMQHALCILHACCMYTLEYVLDKCCGSGHTCMCARAHTGMHISAHVNVNV